MILVLNEWVFHDLWGENGETAFQQTARFLNVFKQSDDRLVLPIATPWQSKAFQLMTRLDTRSILVSQVLHSLLRGSNTIRVQPEDPPSDPVPFLGSVPSEDVYLVLAYVAADADLLVTTDQGLFESLQQQASINCQMRDHFLASYVLAP